MNRLICLGVVVLASTGAVRGQIVLSGNEAKIDLRSGAPKVVPNAPPDSISILNFSRFPPRVEHLYGIANTVVGPPSNIAISPDGRVALIANSIQVDPDMHNQWRPSDEIHVMDLAAKPVRVVGAAQAGQQPSGISFFPDGRHALVANRGDGTITVLAVDGTDVESIQTIRVCEPEESVSDVAIAPDGQRILASIQAGGYLLVLTFQDGTLTATDRRLSVYGHPYRCLITPDGQLALTAGAGESKVLDADAISVVDLSVQPIRTIDHIAIPSVPESIEINPKGTLLAAVVMNGSNLPPEHAHHTENGLLVLLARRGRSFQKVQQTEVGAIPEGVAFTTDGRYLVVQCHPARELWIFEVTGERVRDTGVRISVPGMPSSLRAGPPIEPGI